MKEHLLRGRREDSDQKRRQVVAAIDRLGADESVTIAELARRADVHRSFLYRHPDLYELAVTTPVFKRIAGLVADRDRLRAVVDGVPGLVERTVRMLRDNVGLELAADPDTIRDALSAALIAIRSTEEET